MRLGLISRPSAMRARLAEQQTVGEGGRPAPQAPTLTDGFQPSFWSRGQNSLSKSESPLGWGVVRRAKCLQCSRSAWAEPTSLPCPESYVPTPDIRAHMRDNLRASSLSALPAQTQVYPISP